MSNASETTRDRWNFVKYEISFWMLVGNLIVCMFAKSGMVYLALAVAWSGVLRGAIIEHRLGWDREEQ